MKYIFLLLIFVLFFQSKASASQRVELNASDAISETAKDIKGKDYIDNKGTYSVVLADLISRRIYSLNERELDKYIEWLLKDSKIDFKKGFAAYNVDLGELDQNNALPFACFVLRHFEVNFGYVMGNQAVSNDLNYDEMNKSLIKIKKVLTKLNLETERSCRNTTLSNQFAKILEDLNAGRYSFLKSKEKETIANKLIELQTIVAINPDLQLKSSINNAQASKIEIMGCGDKKKYTSVKLETLYDVEGKPQLEIFRCGKGCKDLGELYSKYLKIIKDSASKDSKYLKTNKEFFEFVNDCSSRIELRVPAQKAQENVKKPSAPAAGAVN